MAAKCSILGVYLIEAEEPCHLIEIAVEGLDKEFDLAEITQEVEGQSRDNWQAPYGEQLLQESPHKRRYAFFFHYLDVGKPLLSPWGPVQLPKPSQVPEHLKDLEYEAP